MSTLAQAHPTKQFFLEMFTRDISLEDCVLDLVDNSIDALIKSRNLSPSTTLLAPASTETPTINADITITLSQDEFNIIDSCGGIDPEYARREAFLFGH